MDSLLRRVYNRLPPALAGVAGSIRYCGLPVPIRTARANSLLSYINLFFLQELARRADVLNLRGDFVECGVYRGGSAGVLGYHAMRSPFHRQLWLYDAFAGMPKATEEDDDYSRSLENTFVGSESQTRQILHHLRVPETRYTIVRGWFEDTLPKATPGPVALLHIDCDFYAPVKLTLETFYRSVEPGGFIILNDYGAFAGCKTATNEFLINQKADVQLIQIDHEAYYFQKPERAIATLGSTPGES